MRDEQRPLLTGNSILTSMYPQNRKIMIKPSKRVKNSNGLLLQGSHTETQMRGYQIPENAPVRVNRYPATMNHRGHSSGI